VSRESGVVLGVLCGVLELEQDLGVAEKLGANADMFDPVAC
jgi:hypothetical protein